MYPTYTKSSAYIANIGNRHSGNWNIYLKYFFQVYFEFHVLREETTFTNPSRVKCGKGIKKLVHSMNSNWKPNSSVDLLFLMAITHLLKSVPNKIGKRSELLLVCDCYFQVGISWCVYKVGHNFCSFRLVYFLSGWKVRVTLEKVVWQRKDRDERMRRWRRYI